MAALEDVPEETRARTVWERAAVPLTGMAGVAFGTLSALRRNRVFHPVGEAFTGEIVFHDEATDVLPLTLFSAGPFDVLVRFSRGVGLPEPAPDILGLAFKIPGAAEEGADQDFLLASSGGPPVVRNLLVPARSFLRATYSSVLPYRARGEQVVVGAQADIEDDGMKGDFGDLRSLVARRELVFDLLVARLGSGWEPVGRLTVGGICPQEMSRGLRFNPWNTRSELQPSGPLNTLRNRAYRSSQGARPA